MIEVELKFALPAGARPALEEKLAALTSLQRFAPSENEDIYYDTADFACLQQAVFLRVRDRTRLEIKYHEHDDPTHVHVTERVFPLAAGPSLLQELNGLCSRFIPDWQPADNVEWALAANQLSAFVHIQKRRTRYAEAELNLYLDQVTGLGDFFEAEVLCTSETEIEQAQERLRAFVASLDVPGLQTVTIGYVELWLRSHLPHVYYLGKYQAEDADRPGAMHTLPISAHVPAQETAFRSPERG